MYWMNLSVLTLLSNCMTSSIPFSLEMPANTATVVLEKLLRLISTGFLMGEYACVGIVDFVTHISSMKTMR